MLRLSLIGPGDIKFHFFELLKFSEEDLNKHIEEIAKVLKNLDVELVLLPDRGVSFEVAKKYKELGGRKVIGTVPASDKDFGIAHLKPFMEAEVNGKKIFDEIIDTENWYKQDLTHCTFGDVVLMLGNSLGSLGELVYGYYLYKLFLGDKPSVSVNKKKIHEKIRAGEIVPFSVIAYKPFLKEKLNYEIEGYVKKLKGEIYYVKSPKQLDKTIKMMLKSKKT